MKTKIFLRIGNDGGKIKVDAHTKVTAEPLRKGNGYRRTIAIPTVFMALNLEVPDEAFKPPNIVASISVPIEKVGTAIEVVDPLRLAGDDCP